MTETYVGRLRSAPALARTEKIKHEHAYVWMYRFAIPLFNVIALYVHIKKLLFAMFDRTPQTNFFFVDGISINSRRMKEGAARWPALNTCYNFAKPEGETWFARLLDDWWMNIRNAQAVRNRLKIAKTELRNAILSKAKAGETVRILSLAAGTAQGVIEVVADCMTLGIVTEIILVDLDTTALRYARDLAHRYGVPIKTIEGNVLFFNRYIGDFKADIVEMMGLVDYLKDGLVTALFRKIRLHLNNGGYFFTCHIHPNGESFFLKKVVDWDMLYRTREELENLLIAGGFLAPQLITEPHGIHSVAVAQKI